ncbi:MAG: LacI family transcriptional regulator [Chelatococcus sp.]|nr:MAG: LacI family transcriptional regulator [Chelatococcus sp.]
MKKTYQQLDPETLAVLREQVERAGSIDAVAPKLGYSRPAVSLALRGKYPGSTDRLRARIVEVFVGGVFCPHVQKRLSAEDCRWWRTCNCPTSSNVAVHHWFACKSCLNNPDRVTPQAFVQPMEPTP